jgi:hypothetical protein
VNRRHRSRAGPFFPKNAEGFWNDQISLGGGNPVARHGDGGARLHTEPGHSPKVVVTSDLIQVKSKGYKSGGYKGGKWHHGKGHGHRYADSHRYKYAPKGWRHYNYRPYRWEHRGCVIVGPVWYCP